MNSKLRFRLWGVCGTRSSQSTAPMVVNWITIPRLSEIKKVVGCSPRHERRLGSFEILNCLALTLLLCLLPNCCLGGKGWNETFVIFKIYCTTSLIKCNLILFKWMGWPKTKVEICARRNEDDLSFGFDALWPQNHNQLIYCIKFKYFSGEFLIVDHFNYYPIKIMRNLRRHFWSLIDFDL